MLTSDLSNVEAEDETCTTSRANSGRTPVIFDKLPRKLLRENLIETI